MEIDLIVFGIIGGLLAGIINTISGSGSIITLSLMAFFGISPDIANGTNRIGILTHGLKGSYSFHQRGQLQLNDNWLNIIICLIGAILGTLTAIYIPSKTFNTVLGIIFCFLFIILLFEPQKKLENKLNFKKALPFLLLPIGFYGGFIQVATGVFLLTILRSVTGKRLQELNPLKVFIIMLFNIPALFIFIWGDKINWPLGISLAIGQYFGAIVGVRINSTKKNLDKALRTLLLILILGAIGKFWGLY